MVRPKKIENIEEIERPLLIIFFLFGFSLMSWVPRFPEVKANLGLNNGDFGILLSMGGAGALLALFTVGHFVNQFGTRKFLPLSALGFSLSIGLIVHREIVFSIQLRLAVFPRQNNESAVNYIPGKR